jgi:hypothetical protein
MVTPLSRPLAVSLLGRADGQGSGTDLDMVEVLGEVKRLAGADGI